MNDEKVRVISRLLEVARLIRRRGTAAESAAALPYEQELEHDLEQRKAELAQLPGLEKEKVAA